MPEYCNTRQELMQAWGNWMTEIGNRIGGWDWYATLTFRDPCDPRRPNWTKPGWSYTGFAWIDFQQYLGLGFGLLQPLPEGALTKKGTIRRDLGLKDAQELMDTATAGIKWVRGRELQRERDVSHFHALISGVSNMRRDEAWAWWFKRYGLARILPYDVTRGAGYYLCKYVTKELGEIEFSHSITREDTVYSRRC